MPFIFEVIVSIDLMETLIKRRRASQQIIAFLKKREFGSKNNWVETLDRDLAGKGVQGNWPDLVDRM